jgi:hypothetical protein
MSPVDAPAARIGLVLAAWTAAHGYADHIGQDSRDACEKGEPDWKGRAACAGHVADLTATKLAALAVAGAATGIRPSPRPIAVAMAIDAASHYVIDRRTPPAETSQGLGQDRVLHPRRPQSRSVRDRAYAMDLLCTNRLAVTGRRVRRSRVPGGSIPGRLGVDRRWPLGPVLWIGWSGLGFQARLTPARRGDRIECRHARA